LTINPSHEKMTYESIRFKTIISMYESILNKII
jgi:hypothetical protein